MLLGPADPVGFRPRRIVINGASGSGKSTLARGLAERLELPYTEVDSLYHGPGWTQRATFLDDVRAIAATGRWVCEWQYDVARPILLDRCDLMVWLDLPRVVTTWLAARRTVGRRLRRQELWNGNYERPLRRILVDPEQIIRWAWSSHPDAEARIAGVLSQRPDLPVVRIRSSVEARSWLELLSEAGGTPERPR